MTASPLDTPRAALVDGIDIDIDAVAAIVRGCAGVSALDPDGPAGGRRTMRWGLRVNVLVTDEGPS